MAGANPELLQDHVVVRESKESQRIPENLCARRPRSTRVQRFFRDSRPTPQQAVEPVDTSGTSDAKNPRESSSIPRRQRFSADSRARRPVCSHRPHQPSKESQRIPENRTRLEMLPEMLRRCSGDSRPIPEPDAPFVHTGRTSRTKNPKESQRIAPDSRCFGDTSQMLWRCSGGSRAHTHTPDESLRESQRIRRRAELQTTQGIPEHRRASRRNGVHVTHTHTSEMVLFFCLCQTKLKFISTSNAHVATPVPARRLRHPAVVHPNDARAERTRRNGTPTRRGRSQPAATKTQKPKNPTLPSFYRKTR